MMQVQYDFYIKKYYLQCSFEIWGQVWWKHTYTHGKKMYNTRVWNENNLFATEFYTQCGVDVMRVCVCVFACMCVFGEEGSCHANSVHHVLLISFLSLPFTLSHTHINSVSFCLSKGIPRKWETVMLVIKCVNTQKHVHTFSLSVFHPLLPGHLIFPTKINKWIMENKWRAGESEPFGRIQR